MHKKSMVCNSVFLSIPQIEKGRHTAALSKASRVILASLCYVSPDHRATHDNSCYKITDYSDVEKKIRFLLCLMQERNTAKAILSL